MEMSLDEARKFVRNRFSELGEGEWWHRDNERTYQELLNIMAPYMSLDLAVSVLSAAFWAAADEYGD